jgi:hypothetical protein
MQGMFALILILAAVSLPVFIAMGAFLYGSKVMGWGFHAYPRTAALVCIMLVAVVFVAALSFNRVFPGCGYSGRGVHFGFIVCDPSIPHHGNGMPPIWPRS